MEQLQRLIATQLGNLDLSSYSECFINLPKLYFQSINKLYSTLKEQGCDVIRFENQGLTRRNNLMLGWLTQV